MEHNTHKKNDDCESSSIDETYLEEKVSDVLPDTSSIVSEDLNTNDENHNISLETIEEEEIKHNPIDTEEFEEVSNIKNITDESICKDDPSSISEEKESFSSEEPERSEKDSEDSLGANGQEKCNCSEIIKEEKKQTSILNKISRQIGHGFRKFKRTWLTFTALGVLIAAIQLWRDYTSPSIADEFQVIFEKNKLSEQYQLPDSMYQYQEVKDLHVMQIELESAYALMSYYPEKIDELIDFKNIKKREDAFLYLSSVRDLYDYKNRFKRIFTNSISKGKILKERLDNKKSNAVLPFSEILLDNVLHAVTEYTHVDSVLDVTTQLFQSSVLIGDSLSSDYISIMDKYSKDARKIYRDPTYKGYFSSILTLLRTINVMVNIRLREIEIEIINGTYEEDEADPQKQLLDLLISLGINS